METTDRDAPVPFLDGLPPDIVQTLRVGARVTSLDAGADAPAFHQAGRYGLVVQGTMGVWRNHPELGNVAVQVLSEGRVFGLAEQFARSAFDTAVMTMCRSQIVELEVGQLQAAMAADGMIRDRVLGHLAREALEISEALCLRSRSVQVRVIWYLLRCCRTESGSAEFPLPVTNRHVAAFLAMSEETMCREMKRLRQLGVSLRRRHVAIDDVMHLRQALQASGMIRRRR